MLGRPPAVCAPAPGSRPSKPALVAGKRAFSALTSTSASAPASCAVWTLLPSQCVEFTFAKSPGGLSLVLRSFG